MIAKSASLFTSFGVNYSMAPLKNGGYKKFTVFAKSASSLTSCRVDYSKTSSKGGGEIFTLTLMGDQGKDEHYLTPDEHYLTPALLESFSAQLERVKKNATDRSVLITTATGDSFSKGFHHSDKNNDRYRPEVIDHFRQLVKDLMSFPMPTIAAINGYAISAGLILAMSHDYLTLTTKMTFPLCMSELNHKITLPEFFTAMIRSKVTPSALPRLVLNTSALNSKDAKMAFGLAMKHPLAETQSKEALDGNEYTELDAAEELAEKLSEKRRDGEVYAKIRKALYPDLCSVLERRTATFSPSQL